MAAAPFSSFVLVADETTDGILFTIWGWDDLNIEEESQRDVAGNPPVPTTLGAKQIIGSAVPSAVADVLNATTPRATIKKTQHVLTRAVAATRFNQLLTQLFAEVPAS